jgi:glyoxylase-like metal-dependent hydrolase (beta-lactamase superfamily II)
MAHPVIYPLLTGTAGRDRATFLMGASAERITIPFVMFYIRAEGRHILVDTGVGAPEDTLPHHHPMNQTPEQKPEAALARVGVRPEDIDTVVNTHLHWDHCTNNHLFPNATIYVQRAEIQYVIAPLPAHAWAYDVIDLEDGRQMPPPFLRSRLTPIEGDLEIAPGVSLLLSPGHTPGSQSVVVQGRNTYVLSGDNVPLYDNLPGGHGPQFTPCSIYVDMEAYYRSFRRLLDAGGEILPSHDMRVLDRERYG